MPALFVFLFKVNIALLLFCAGYYLVLRHLTFYTLNRVYLVTAIIFSTLYPNIDLTGFAQKHVAIAKPVQTVAIYWQAPAQTLIKPLAHPNYWYWASVVFWAGAALLGIRLLVQLFSLYKLYRGSKPGTVNNHQVRLINGEAAPFSFWRSIYVNPANHTPTDLEAILQHEQVHVNGLHTVDILLAELSSIFYWFNPGIWLMKKAVRENIEFITDRKILNKGFDTKTYQYSLVNVSFNSNTPGIVNHFNISTIKKRIIMMNAKRSSRFTLTRYVFVVPAVVALLLVFTLTKASVTKPINVKLNSMVKPVSVQITRAMQPVTAAIKTAATSFKTAITIQPDTVPDKPEKLKIVADMKVEIDSVRKANINKARGTVTITTNNNLNINSMDSANFVVNGVKTKPSDFKNVNPQNIEAINIVSADALDGILGPDRDLRFDNNNKVVFVTTKDSEAGKKLLKKLGTNRQLTNLRVIKDGVPQSINGTDIAIFGKGSGGSASSISGTGVARNNGTVTVTNYANPKLFRTDSGLRFKNGVGLQLDKNITDNTGLAQVEVFERPATLNKLNNQVHFINSNGNVNRISDKLIIIDGKEATEKELKKISAFDIDRMDIQSNSDTIKKYGDKAKYGVVYIYTKKGK
ncbi:M56 family metallopeptidase [Inquilinus sp. KBS0705]|nr:M56 family metallopeptidase [Inquilinus sp. KBS0705]